MWRNSSNLQPLPWQIFEKLLAEMKKIHSFYLALKKFTTFEDFARENYWRDSSRLFLKYLPSELVEISGNSSCGSFVRGKLFCAWGENLIFSILRIFPGEFKVYTRRWIVLAIFVFYSASNAMQWIQFSIIANVVQKYVFMWWRILLTKSISLSSPKMGIDCLCSAEFNWYSNKRNPILASSSVN